MAATHIAEMSKTFQYRKVMKPLLERKRRARINKCLDELKELVVAALEADGEHVTRLEKADILELTVTHLQRLKQRRRNAAKAGISQAEGFRSGYIHAVNEVSRSLSDLPSVNVSLGTQLMTHLGQRLNQLQPAPQPQLPPTAPLSVQVGGASYRTFYAVPPSPLSSRNSSPHSSIGSEPQQASLLVATRPTSPVDVTHVDEEDVWRPW